jgi:hypothetical protein
MQVWWVIWAVAWGATTMNNGIVAAKTAILNNKIDLLIGIAFHQHR